MQRLVHCFGVMCALAVGSVDASAQGEPCLLGQFGHATQGVQELDSTPLAVLLDGDLAYVGESRMSKFAVVDLSDVSSSVELSSISVTGANHQINSMLQRGESLFIVTSNQSLYTVDVSDPVTPQVVSVFDLGFYPGSLAIRNHILWVSGGSEVVTLNVSTPEAPFVVDMAMGEF